MDGAAVRAQVEACLARGGQALEADQYEAVLAECEQAFEWLQGLDADADAQRWLRVRILLLQGGALLSLRTHKALREAIAAYGAVIATMQAVDLSETNQWFTLALAQVNLGNAWQKLGTHEALREAIDAYDAAIATLQMLDISKVGYGHVLAIVQRDQGLSWWELGTPEGLHKAIDSYDAAIKTLQSFDSLDADCRHTLATVQCNQGIVWVAIGTHEALHKAIAVHSAAIATLQTLDLAVPEYRFALAQAQESHGSAWQILGTPEALREAIVIYGAAIKTLQTLDPWVPAYRYTLAQAQGNQGSAWQALGTPEALSAALTAYDASIATLQTLDLSEPNHRYMLASAKMNRGNIWRALGTPEAYAHARDAYRAALDSLPEATAATACVCPLRWLKMAAITHGNLSIVESDCGNPPAAVDAADDGLALLRAAERHGIRQFRQQRERLFKIAIDVYLAWQQPQFLPELIDEHLDPDQPGSATASVAMQRDALGGLHRALAIAIDEKRPELATDIAAALQRLHHWQQRYFAGTATAVRLRAGDAELCGDPQRARRLIVDYTAARPLDPEGWATLADFEQRCGTAAAALAAWQQAAGALIASVPVLTDQVSQRCGELAAQMLKLRFKDVWLPHERDALLAHCEQLHTWLQRDFLTEALTAARALAGKRAPDQSAWQHALEPVLAAVWAPIVEQRSQWLDQLEAGKLEQLQTQWRQQLRAASRQLAETLCVGLPRPWSEFVAALQMAWEDLCVSANSTAAPAAEREEALIDALSVALRRASASLAEAELAEAGRALQAALGPVWDEVLDESAQRYLACARRCLDEPVLQRYAGLELGLSVEHLLLSRLYEPLQAEQRGRAPLAATGPANDGEVKVLAFLNGTGRPPMLGAQISVFNRALRRLDTPAETEPLYARMCALLHELPSVHTLRAEPAAARERRRRLAEINDCRIASAHPQEQPSGAQLQSAWESVVGDAVDGFVHYFGRAHLYG